MQASLRNYQTRPSLDPIADEILQACTELFSQVNIICLQLSAKGMTLLYLNQPIWLVLASQPDSLMPAVWRSKAKLPPLKKSSNLDVGFNVKVICAFKGTSFVDTKLVYHSHGVRFF